MSKKKSAKSSIPRTVALCYIRQSYTHGKEDQNSPERQKANCIAICHQRGFTPEIYMDTGGHKSATTELGRPKWLELKTRLSAPDVVALVTNDQSRLHRNPENMIPLPYRRGLIRHIRASSR